MDSPRVHSGSVLQQTVTLAVAHPFLAALLAAILTSTITRLVTGLQYRSQVARNAASPDRPGTVPVLPYWIPFIGHAFAFATGGSDFLTRAARSLGPDAAIFAMVMGNSKHHVVTAPSVARQILVDRASPVDMEDFVLHVMTYFWDDRGATRALDPNHLWGNIHGVLSGMLRESFVTSAIRGTVERVEQTTYNLVSGARSPVDQSLWERQANVQIVSGGDGDSDFVAEASLHPLIRHFVGDIASNVLMGHEFMANNPNVMLDLWELDTRFNLFNLGLPGWFPGLTSPARARERLIAAIEEHHAALFKFLDGEDPGPRWSDLSDVSSVIVDRARAFRAAGAPPRGYATGNGAILWAMNVNANPVIFWMLFYVYSDAALLQEIRAEVAPHVRLQHPTPTGLPVQAAPTLQIDMPALWARCPLLKGAFFETMRIEAASLSYKRVSQDFVVRESPEDAALLGNKAGAQSWLLRTGELVCIPHGVHQSDDKYFRDPARFDARRFWSKEAVNNDDNNNEDDHTAVKVEYGTMKVWGGGKQMCKGKTFAEREVVLFAAAILMQWDMTPVGNGGKWTHPGRIVGAGAGTPKKDVRVRMTRREGW